MAHAHAPHASPQRSSDHLKALDRLVARAFPDAVEYFEHGLNLLVQDLRVDRALMSMRRPAGWEVFWWAGAAGEEGRPCPDPGQGFCAHVLEHPNRTLVIRDAETDPRWCAHPHFTVHGVRAYCGAPLRQSGAPSGVLSVQSAFPRHFSKAEIALVNAVANLFSKTLEVEALKTELHLTREALDLSSAVVEDSALEDPATRLPNPHYLEIWLRANLHLARRRGEPMGVVRWRLPRGREQAGALRDLADSLRGEDLLVDLRGGDYLLLLPRTLPEGAQILLERIKARLGEIPMGATQWNPLQAADREDLAIRGALRRSREALDRSLRAARQGRCTIEWELPSPGSLEGVVCS